MDETTATPPAPLSAIIAINPQQMADARRSTSAWIEAKLNAALDELDNCDKVLGTMLQARLNVAPARSQIDKAAKRVRFYEKVKAALAAGYYIVPPFDVQLFAVRVNRKSGRAINSDAWQRESNGQHLPVGEGRFVDPQIQRVKAGKKIEQRGTPPQPHEVQLYRDRKFFDEIDLPVRAMKPTIIDAVGRALTEKIFDALGIAPQYRAADPIICGRINKPSGGHLSFLIAWWIDAEDLDA